MRLIISALHFNWSSLEQCLHIVRHDLGLDGVELSCHPSFRRPHCTREDLERLPTLKQETGLTIDAHIWEDLARLGPDAGSEALLEWLRWCEKTGIESLVLHGGSYPVQREGIQRTREALCRVLGRYERAGVVLKLENHYAFGYRGSCELFSEPWEFLELFAACDSPALRVCYDTGHGHMTGNGEALLRALWPYLSHIHLADNHGQHDDHCPYRHGSVPWDDLLLLWRELGYDQTFCIEFPVRDDRQPFHRCVADLRRLAHPAA
ncbi:MAG: sugar phosphate isomerase/epimerase family protein [Armatimonadota bacterium]|nr:sugar phosphate isomerase/epimerase family protein [Armatimonadota bacterium]